MTRRAIAAATAAAVAIGLLAPWLLGLYAEQLYRAWIDALSNAGYRIVQDAYRRDWLQSTALLVVAPPESGGLEAPRLQAASRIAHGPRSDAFWRWPPVLAFARSRVTVIGGPRRLPPLQVTAALEAGGSLDAELGLPDITYSGNAGSLHLIDGRGALRYAGDDEGWSGRGELPMLEAVDLSERALVLKGLAWQFALRNLTGGVPLGEVTLSLKALKVDAALDQSLLDLGGLVLELSTAVDGGQAKASAEMRIDQLTVKRAVFAPSVLQLRLTGVDAPSLATLLDELRRLNKRHLPESMRGLAMGALLTQSLPDLVSAEPRLTLEHLKLTTPKGAVTARGHLTLSGGGATAGPPDFWLRRISGEAQVSVPQALVLQLLIDEQRRQVQHELSNRGERVDPLPVRLAEEVEAAAQASLMLLLRDGWLLADRGRLSASAVLGDGLLILNGKTLPMTGWTGPRSSP